MSAGTQHMGRVHDNDARIEPCPRRDGDSDWIAATDAVVRGHGRLDIRVTNAGVALLRDIKATALEERRALMAVNLDGTLLGCKHSIRVMKERGDGSIVNLGSVAGMIGNREPRGRLRQQGWRAAAHQVCGARSRAARLQYPLQLGASV